MWEIANFLFGVVIGFLFGVLIYWLPIGQFFNEMQSLWNLVYKRYPEGTNIIVRGRIDLKPQNTAQSVLLLSRDTPMTVWLEEGIGWHHTHSGWLRARILQVWISDSKEEFPNHYRICHRDILKKVK